MKNCLLISGLIFTLLGAAILTYGGLASLAARIRQMENMQNKRIPPGPWYQNLVVWLARHFGSKDSQAMEVYDVPNATTIFWGFFFIFIGTILQILGNI